MALLSGTVSFSRFHVVGGSPKRLDDNLLEKFRNHRIGRQRIMRADHEDVGWIGGRHILDAEFGIERNVRLDCLHLGMRIDMSRVPPDLMRAYVQQELDSLYRTNGNGNGAANGRGKLKRQAIEAARQRAEDEIKTGRYRRLRQSPVLWDTGRNVLYLGATTPTVLERLYPLFKETVGKRLEPMTAGFLSERWSEKKGITRRLDNLKPTVFVRHPDSNGHAEVYWTAHDAASRDFLGNEFLLWLWYTLAERSDTIKLADDTEAAVVIVKQLTLECPRAETGKEVITCDGPAQLPESRRAIQSGKLPRKVGLIVSRQGEQYEFTLQAETFNISAARLPKIEEDGHGLAGEEERVEQLRHLSDTVDLLFVAFLERRFSTNWESECEQIRAWLRQES